MTDQAPDDVFALYSRFDLDGDGYRVFRRAPDPEPRVAARSVETRSVLLEAPPYTPAPVETLYTSAPVEAPLPERTHKPMRHSPVEDTSASLRSLWRVTAGRGHRGAASAEALASASISVHGAAGGVGSSTVAAVLTRLFAKTGKCCAIFNEAEDPTLPIFFGGQRMADAHRRFSALQTLFEPRIEVLNRKMFEAFESADAPDACFIHRHFRSMETRFDHLIFDHSTTHADSIDTGIKIYVAIPDLRSLAGMQKFIRHQETPTHASHTVCVLNRFDASSGLHKEVLGWYRENFRELAVVHESSLVPEALAEGTTVLDWAPDATVSTDFLNLFAAVNRVLGLNLERLSLCS